jgi:hypothetical protein
MSQLYFKCRMTFNSSPESSRSYISVLSVIYLCVVGHISVCCGSYICVLSVIYLCVVGIHLPSFYDLSVVFLKRSDLVCLFFIL